MAKVYNRHHGSAPDGAVHIGRGSEYGNPYVIGRHGTRRMVIRMFYYWLLAQPDVQRKWAHDLHGKDLVCYCAPEECHGDILLALASTGKMPPCPSFHADSRYIRRVCDILGAEVVDVIRH